MRITATYSNTWSTVIYTWKFNFWYFICLRISCIRNFVLTTSNSDTVMALEAEKMEQNDVGEENLIRVSFINLFHLIFTQKLDRFFTRKIQVGSSLESTRNSSEQLTSGTSQKNGLTPKRMTTISKF